ncbi:MAG: hypothetical protein ACFFDF_05175 [Candidatus Odinarchaeota archaeon]
MSSGNIEQNYFKNFQDCLHFKDSIILSQDITYKSHSFESKSLQKEIDGEIHNKNQDLQKDVINIHFEKIEEIHFILKYSQHLTQKEKYEYCNSQRFFMKLYLKSISERF